ncbi:MAG: hypothetical protein HY271_06525 [Deltaproteobacteria bacterium]|nr:hypothetical protein [Deltaproteobacteria bacterium]
MPNSRLGHPDPFHRKSELRIEREGVESQLDRRDRISGDGINGDGTNREITNRDRSSHRGACRGDGRATGFGYDAWIRP